MGKWIRVDRRYNQPLRPTKHIWRALLLGAAIFTAWVTLSSFLPFAGLVGAVALCGWTGFTLSSRWESRRTPQATPAFHIPPPTMPQPFPPGAPTGERNPRVIPQDVKIQVAVRDAGRCRHCGSSQDLHFDHVIPWSKGGANTVNNIQLLCGPCNRAKGADDIPATL